MSLKTRLEEAFTRVGTEFKAVRTTTGALTDLTTTAKTSLVAAINEIKASSGAPPMASDTTPGLAERATLAETGAGLDDTRFVTAAGVRQERTALKTELLGGATAAWDTLAELKALIDAGDAEDQADIATLLTAIGEKANAADVYTKAQIGDPEQDLVAVLVAALA